LLAVRALHHVGDLHGVIADATLLKNTAFTMSINEVNMISMVMTLIGLPFVYWLGKTPSHAAAAKTAAD